MKLIFLEIKNEKIFQIVYYVFFAGAATIFDFGILYLLTDKAHLHYFISAAISYTVGMAVNYTLNKFFNFKDKDKKIALQFGVFVGVALVGLALNQAIISALVELFGLWYMFAKAVSLLLVMFWSFWAHKNITFNLKRFRAE